MPRGKIVKRQEDRAILGQALGGLGILGLIRSHAEVKRHLGTLAVGRQPDGLEALFGLRLEVLRQFVKAVGRLMHPTPLAARLAIHVAQRCPKPHRAIPNGQGGAVLQPAAFEVAQEVFPGLCARAVAIPEADAFFVATRGSPNEDEETVPCFLQARRKVYPVDPDIDGAFPRKTATLPRRQCLVPALFQPPERRWREPRGFWSHQRLSGLGKIARRYALQGEPGEQRLKALRATDRGWQEKRVKWYASPTAVTDTWHLGTDGATTCVHLPLGEEAIADQDMPPLGLPLVGIRGEQQSNFRLNRLRQKSLRTLASHRSEGILSRQLWMWKGHDSILLHGVSTPVVWEG